MTEDIDVKLSVERVYHSLLNFLKAQPDMKIKRFIEPSLIEADIGRTRFLPPRHVSENIQIEVFPVENRGSRVKFRFDFSDYWLKELPLFLLVYGILIVFAVWLKNPRLLGATIGLGAVFLVFAYYQTDVRKKRFLERFKGFLSMAE